MSLKIERDTFQQATASQAVRPAAKAAKDGVLPGTSGKHPHLAKIGTAITGGKENAGTKGYLAVRHPAGPCPNFKGKGEEMDPSRDCRK